MSGRRRGEVGGNSDVRQSDMVGQGMVGIYAGGQAVRQYADEDGKRKGRTMLPIEASSSGFTLAIVL